MADPDIAPLGDVPVEIEVQLDRRMMTVREILRLGPESILELGRSAGENVDVVAAGVQLGCGEVVVVENTVAVRITDFKPVSWNS
ncbi:MAG: FliM/FliN family flagellar motor switch protein [Bryobacteraceae bacterium]